MKLPEQCKPYEIRYFCTDSKGENVYFLARFIDFWGSPYKGNVLIELKPETGTTRLIEIETVDKACHSLETNECIIVRRAQQKDTYSLCIYNLSKHTTNTLHFPREKGRTLIEQLTVANKGQFIVLLYNVNSEIILYIYDRVRKEGQKRNITHIFESSYILFDSCFVGARTAPYIFLVLYKPEQKFRLVRTSLTNAENISFVDVSARNMPDVIYLSKDGEHVCLTFRDSNEFVICSFTSNKR